VGRDPLLAVTTRRGRWGSVRDGGPVAAPTLVVHHPELDALAVAVGLDGAEGQHRPTDAVDVAAPVLQRHRSRGGGRRQREPAVEPQGRAAVEPHRRAAVGAGEGRAALLGVADVQRALARAAVPHLDRLDGRHRRTRGRAVDQAPVVDGRDRGAGVGDGGVGAGARVAGLPGRAAVAARAAVRDVGLEVRTSTDRRGRRAGVGGGRLAAVGRAVAVAAADAVAAHRALRPVVDRRGTSVGRGGRVGLDGGDEVHVAAREGRGAEDEGEGERADRGAVHGGVDQLSDRRISAASLRDVGTGEPRSQPPCDGRQRRVRTGR
jgi:hypothetical protein